MLEALTPRCSIFVYINDSINPSHIVSAEEMDSDLNNPLYFIRFYNIEGIEWTKAPDWATHLVSEAGTGNFYWTNSLHHNLGMLFSPSFLEEAHQYRIAKLGSQYHKNEWQNFVESRPIKNVDDSVTLTSKQYKRMLVLACNECNLTEKTLFEMINNDEHPMWRYEQSN